MTRKVLIALTLVTLTGFLLVPGLGEAALLDRPPAVEGGGPTPTPKLYGYIRATTGTGIGGAEVTVALNDVGEPDPTPAEEARETTYTSSTGYYSFNASRWKNRWVDFEVHAEGYVVHVDGFIQPDGTKRKDATLINY